MPLGLRLSCGRRVKMENTGKRSAEELKIQELLGAFLVSRENLKSSAAETSYHLDEDSLAVFAEGNLSERESLPVVSHLVDCGFCRHKTAELVRLNLDFASADQRIPVEDREPSKISEVLSGLLAKIFGTTDEAVFAHQEKESDEKTAEDDEQNEETK